MKNFRFLGILPLLTALLFTGCEKARVENDSDASLENLVVHSLKKNGNENSEFNK